MSVISCCGKNYVGPDVNVFFHGIVHTSATTAKAAGANAKQKIAVDPLKLGASVTATAIIQKAARKRFELGEEEEMDLSEAKVYTSTAINLAPQHHADTVGGGVGRPIWWERRRAERLSSVVGRQPVWRGAARLRALHARDGSGARAIRRHALQRRRRRRRRHRQRRRWHRRRRRRRRRRQRWRRVGGSS